MLAALAYETRVFSFAQAWVEAQALRERLSVLDAQCNLVAAVRNGSLSLTQESEDDLVQALRAGGYATKGVEGFRHLLQLPAVTFTGTGLGALSEQRDAAREQLQALRKEAAQYAREQARARVEAGEAQQARLAEAVKALQDYKAEAGRSVTALQEEARAKLAAVLEAVAAREGELLAQALRVEQTKKTQLAEQAEELQGMVAALDASCGAPRLRGRPPPAAPNTLRRASAPPPRSEPPCLQRVPTARRAHRRGLTAPALSCPAGRAPHRRGGRQARSTARWRWSATRTHSSRPAPRRRRASSSARALERTRRWERAWGGVMAPARPGVPRARRRAHGALSARAAPLQGCCIDAAFDLALSINTQAGLPATPPSHPAARVCAG